MTERTYGQRLDDALRQMRYVSEVAAQKLDGRISGSKESVLPRSLPSLFGEGERAAEGACRELEGMLERALKRAADELTAGQRDYWIAQTAGRPDEVAKQFRVAEQTVRDVRHRAKLNTRTGKPLERHSTRIEGAA